MPPEALFYNALNILLEADYGKLRRLRASAPSWQAAWEIFPENLRQPVQPEKEWRKLESAGLHIIMAEEDSFPPLLREIPLPPFGIYVRDALPEPDGKTIAIVGTRRATPGGKETATRFGAELSNAGINIVSGLAFGIDAAAHTGALQTKTPTFAVLANGLDTIYPRTHESLAKRIIENGGGLISEYPLGAPSWPYRFLARNRIVSGLAQGVIIIEAPIDSGAMATARFALDQNREVLVVPGPINHP
ncbi:MAG: DNA-processing protein DprA, partial [Patescibacteria group bacterium]